MAVVVAVGAYGWWLTDLEPFSDAALAAMLAFGLVLIAVAQTHRARRRRVDPATDRTHTPTRSAVRRSIAMWSVVVGLLLAWELSALFSQPRDDHPTISSLTEVLQEHHPTRLALFALWAWFGWTLAS